MTAPPAPPTPPIITLTTDFGIADGYVGTMKGVILGRCPTAHLVDLSHAVTPQDIAGGAFVLYTSTPYFPPGTVHLAVVDPGVGSARRGVLIVTAAAMFIGPDNGLFSDVLLDAVAQATGGTGDPPGVPAPWHPAWDGPAALAAAAPEDLPRAYLLSNAALWRAPQASATFHGRDVFAPVAAYLAAGGDPAEVGPPLPLADLTRLAGRAPQMEPGIIRGQIIAVDHFGNAISNIAAGLLDRFAPRASIAVEAGPHRLESISPTYAAAPPATPLALINSAGLLEIALRDGHAARALGLMVGTPITCYIVEPARSTA